MAQIGRTWLLQVDQMAATIPKINPLMLLYKKSPDMKIAMTEQELDRFFPRILCKSDIDVACNHSNIIDFIEHVKHLRKTIKKNLGQNVKESDVQICPTKNLAIYINATLLKKNVNVVIFHSNMIM